MSKHLNMYIEQEILIKYLKQQFFSITESSDDLEKDVFLYLTDKGLMRKRIRKEGYASITIEGKAFLVNSDYFNPIPDSVYDWKMNIINQLKSDRQRVKGQGKDFQRALLELKIDGIIEQGNFSNCNKLTTKGWQFLDSELSYSDYLKYYDTPPSNIVNNITGQNGRKYRHSQNYYTSTENIRSESLFVSLKLMISEKIYNNTELLKLVNELEQNIEQSDYIGKYKAFIANAANHMTLIGPFIPALTALIPFNQLTTSEIKKIQL